MLAFVLNGTESDTKLRAPPRTPWGNRFGHSRALRVGDQVFVGGTAPSDEEGNVVGKGDPYAQMNFVVIEKIGGALKEVGSSLEDIVRVRVFATDIAQVESIGRSFSEHFAGARLTVVQVSRLIDPEMLLEVEAEAVGSA